MADYCKQCSIDVWGRDSRDLAWGDDGDPDLTPDSVAVVMCEGCNMPGELTTIVNPEGVCVAQCNRGHGRIHH